MFSSNSLLNANTLIGSPVTLLLAAFKKLVTEIPGTSAGVWKDMKMPFFRLLSGDSSVMSSPFQRILPEVTVYSGIQNAEIIPLLDYAQRNYRLSQKNFIALGAIAQAEKIRSIDLIEYLQLSDEERLHSYINNLLKEEIIIKDGRGKGTSYKVNPKLIINSKVNKKTTLKTIEPYRLKALVLEDLKVHPMSIMDDIAKRLPDVDFNDLKKMVRKMATNGEIHHDNGRKFRKYYC